MRELTVSFTGDGKAAVGSSHNYQDEHCAVRLAITLSNDMTAVSPDEYYISFIRDADADNPMPQKITAGPVEDLRDGVLYYELPSSLTATTCLAAQLEAVKYDGNGGVQTIVKSPAFFIRLHPSLQGDEALPDTCDAGSLLERLLNATSQTEMLNETLTEALDQGVFQARINGRSAVTLCGGRNLILTDENGTVTIDCSTLPVVSSLPVDPQEGDLVLLIPHNEIARRDSGMELMTGVEMLAAVARSEEQLLAQDPESRCPLYLNLRQSGDIVGFVSITSDLEEDEMGRLNAFTSVSFVTKMRRNQPYDGYEIVFINGTFSNERSTVQKNGIITAMTVVPDSVRLPDFDTVETLAREQLPLPVFFASSALFAYKSRWLEINSVAADKQFHQNKATLDGFVCDAAEAQANTPAGQPVIGLQYTGWDRLRWGGGEVRMVDDGGVIDNVETVTVNGKSFLRLWMDYGEVQTIWAGMGERPKFIDIPIDSATSSIATQGELTVNGTELDFGIDSLEADAHTHTNKAVLDDIGSTTITGAIKVATYETRPINGVRSMEILTDGYNGTIYAGVPLVFGTSQTQSIVISSFTNNALYFYPEYVLEFTTGATAPTLTLPAAVEWADELTVEANKHYQISIVNNIALWCAVDVEAVSE